VLRQNDSSSNGAGYTWDKESVARRAYKNKALAMLCSTGDEKYRAEALKRFRAADNMTDSVAAINAVVDYDCEERTEMLAELYDRWKDEPLVTLKWLTMQVCPHSLMKFCWMGG
jgi:aminopeptidase N